jgi:uncharacterized membrane protein YhdT
MKSVLIASIASLLAGFVIGTNFLSVYSTDKQSGGIYSLGDAILFSIPAYSQWRFEESMKAYRLRPKLKSKDQLGRETDVYSAAVPNESRCTVEVLAILGMAVWFVASGLTKTYEVLCENPSWLEPIMTLPLLGHALRFLKAYW